MQEPLEESPEEQRVREMMQMYRNVFGTPEGRIVLGDILTLGHFGETLNPDDPARFGEYSLAVVIARQAGAFDQLWRDLGLVPKGE